MYANEKGHTVFAIYSKSVPDDPTNLQGTKGRKTEREYSDLIEYLNGRQIYGEQDKPTLDRLLREVESNSGAESASVYHVGSGQSEIEDVPVPFEKRERNWGRDLVNGEADIAPVTEYNEEASEKSGASFVIFSNYYAAIRNFVKEGVTGEDIAPVQYPYTKITKDYNMARQGLVTVLYRTSF